MDILPNLNAAPIAPAAPVPTPNRSSFQANPQQSDQSFTKTLAKEVADRRAASNDDKQVKPNTASAHSAQNAQNTQGARNTQSAEPAKSGENAKSAQGSQNAQNNPDGDAAPVNAKTEDKDADQAKSKSDADTAGSDADKTSTELLALVASVNGGKLAQPAQAPAAPDAPQAVPVTAQLAQAAPAAAIAPLTTAVPGAISPTVADAAAPAALAATLPDALDAKTGKGGKPATTPAASLKAEANPAAGDTATAAAGAVGNTPTAAAADKAGQSFVQQLTAAAGANAAQGHAMEAKPGIDPQAAATGVQGPNTNAAFIPAMHQVAGSPLQAPAAGDKLAPQVGSSGWDEALGQKVVWMTNNGQQSATLTLNPPDLGPMQVVINVNKTEADATFIASNPEVKQALEAAMPKLREMLEQAGIQLGQSNVSTGMPNQQQPGFNQAQSGSGSGRRGGGPQDDGGAASAITAPATASGGGQGLVDTFV